MADIQEICSILLSRSYQDQLFTGLPRAKRSGKETLAERPEAVDSGTASLVGPNAEHIVEESERLIKNQEAYQRMAPAVSPHGDGHAAERIINVCKKILHGQA